MHSTKKGVIITPNKMQGGLYMIKAKFDIIQALKDKGYNTNRIRIENIIGQSTLTTLRTGDLTGVNLKTINAICSILKKQPGQLLEFIPDYKPGSNQD